MKKATEKIFIIIIVFWISLATFNVLYNSAKSISEIKEWAFLSDNEKRAKIFGDSHSFFHFIKNNTKDKSHILIYSTNVTTPFLSMYYLYPRRITVTDNRNEFKKSAETGSYNYFAIYNEQINFEHSKNIASYTSRSGAGFGSLYIIK